MKYFRMGDTTLGENNPVYIIAEIGINHEGNYDTCVRLIDAAIAAGADAIKFQTIDPDASYTKETESYKLFKRAEFSWHLTADLFAYVKKQNVDVFTTSADIDSINQIELLEPAAYKISSGLMNHYPLIQHIAAKQRPVIISTGMSDIKQISEVVQLIENTGNQQICILQCTSLYPCPVSELNLNNIAWFKTLFEYPIGFSDHSVGIEMAQYAVAAGACVIEKHFTLDSNLPGFDHRLSLQPDEFAKMVQAIRTVELALGRKGKILQGETDLAKQQYQRYIVAGRPLKSGDRIAVDDIAFKRSVPGRYALEPVECEKLLGKILLNDVNKNQLITLQDVRH